MTPEQINIAIAEACGWTVIGHSDGLLMGCRPGNSTIRNPIPNYHDDLNACHEMENVLELQDSDLFGRYVMEVARVVDLQGGYYITATAPQRCEAFLKVIGKWEN